MSRKPPCPKCGSTTLNLEIPRFQPESAHISCYMCGWALYGEERIRTFTQVFLQEKKKEEARLRARAECDRKRRAEIFKAKRGEERLIAANKRREEKAKENKRASEREYRARLRDRKREEKALIDKQRAPFPFKEGDIDPVLLLPWSIPKHDESKAHLNPCAWPPCLEYSRKNSKYCCRKCGVKVAHKRDRLRKAGKLSA